MSDFKVGDEVWLAVAGGIVPVQRLVVSHEEQVEGVPHWVARSAGGVGWHLVDYSVFRFFPTRREAMVFHQSEVAARWRAIVGLERDELQQAWQAAEEGEG